MDKDMLFRARIAAHLKACQLKSVLLKIAFVNFGHLNKQTELVGIAKITSVDR